jgi:hypothetical protein
METVARGPFLPLLLFFKLLFVWSELYIMISQLPLRRAKAFVSFMIKAAKWTFLIASLATLFFVIPHLFLF